MAWTKRLDDSPRPFSSQERAIIQAATVSFRAFLKYVYPESFADQTFPMADRQKHPFSLGWIHEYWADIAQDNPRFCILAPRLHLKSTILNHGLAFWKMFSAMHDLNGLVVSYSDPLASKHTEKIKQAIFRNKFCRFWIDNNPMAKSIVDFTVDFDEGPTWRGQIEPRGIFSNMRGLHLPLLICFTPDQKVRTGFSSYAEIKTLEPGDLVIGHSGNSRRIQEVQVRPYDGELIEIEYGHHSRWGPAPIFKATPNHRMLTKRGWIPAGELEVGDILETGGYIRDNRRRKNTKPFYTVIYCSRSGCSGARYVTPTSKISAKYCSKECKQLDEHIVLTEETSHNKKNSINVFAVQDNTGRVVTSIKRSHYIGDVYNLDVEEDHTYQLEQGIIAKNCDDILGTVANPLQPTEIRNIDNIFHSDLESIPDEGETLALIGTPQSYEDTLYTLRSNPTYYWARFPAELPDNKTLWPEKFDMARLKRVRRTVLDGPYEVEYLLVPMLATNSFLPEFIVKAAVEDTMKPAPLNTTYDPGVALGIYGGMDVGKHIHPSHVSLGALMPTGDIVQIYEEYLDGMNYHEQALRIRQLIDHFHVRRFYYDSTRSEMEDRGMPHAVIGVVFNQRRKSQMALALEHLLFAEEGDPHLILLPDARQSRQLVAVDRDLRSLETADGHGDAFWAIALMCMAAADGPTLQIIGDAQSAFSQRPSGAPRSFAGAY